MTLALVTVLAMMFGSTEGGSVFGLSPIVFVLVVLAIIALVIFIVRR